MLSINATNVPLAIEKAIRTNNTEALKKLVDRSNVNHLLPNQQLPLHLAVSYNHSEAVNELLRLGANPRYCDSQNLNAVENACLRKNKKLISEMVSHIFKKDIQKENINWKESEASLKRIKSLVEKISNINSLNLSPLADYAYHGEVKAFNEIFNNLGEEERKNLIINPDEHGFSLIHYAMAGGQRKIFSLCREQMNSEELKEIKTKNGDTLLHWATICNAKSFIYDFLGVIDSNVKNNFNETPLHYALGNRDLWAAKILIGKRAKLFEKDAMGITPFNLIATHAFQRNPLAISSTAKTKFIISAVLIAAHIATKLWNFDEMLKSNIPILKNYTASLENLWGPEHPLVKIGLDLSNRGFPKLEDTLRDYTVSFSHLSDLMIPTSTTNSSFLNSVLAYLQLSPVTLLMSNDPYYSSIGKLFLGYQSVRNNLKELKISYKNSQNRKWDATKKIVILSGNTLFSLYTCYLFCTRSFNQAAPQLT